MNTATESGGAINYNLYRPILNSNTFNSNIAAYGKDISSYAIKMKIKDSHTDEIRLNNVGSGIEYDTPFILALYDHDGQI